MFSREKAPSIIVIFCSLLLSGCVASVPMTSTTLDAQAKSFSPESGKANIYINCLGGTGNQLVWQVMLDGHMVGSLASGTYLLLSVSPGEHTITVTFPGNAKQLKVNALSGVNYYFNTRVSMGWTASNLQLDPINESAAKDQLRRARRAENIDFK